MKIKTKWKGMHSYRYKREPMEKAFAKAFQTFCEGQSANTHPSNLDYLLSPDNNHPIPCSDRDRQVACTVIQWLGSTVGQQFIQEIREKADGK